MIGAPHNLYLATAATHMQDDVEAAKCTHSVPLQQQLHGHGKQPARRRVFVSSGHRNLDAVCGTQDKTAQHSTAQQQVAHWHLQRVTTDSEVANQPRPCTRELPSHRRVACSLAAHPHWLAAGQRRPAMHRARTNAPVSRSPPSLFDSPRRPVMQGNLCRSSAIPLPRGHSSTPGIHPPALFSSATTTRICCRRMRYPSLPTRDGNTLLTPPPRWVRPAAAHAGLTKASLSGYRLETE